MPSAAKRCQGRRRDGAACQSPAVAATGYCFAHDPEAEAARHVREEQRKGRDAEAEKWRSVQAAIRQIRGPLQS